MMTNASTYGMPDSDENTIHILDIDSLNTYKWLISAGGQNYPGLLYYVEWTDDIT